MAEIPRRLWDRYTAQLQRQAATASAFVTRSVSAYMASHPRASVADVREAARRALEQAVKAYGLLAAELAALMYDECLRAAGAEGVEPASPDGGSGIADEADKIARYQAKKLVKGDRGGFIAQLGKSAADRVLARANDTVVAAASRPADRRAGVRWARVLTGLENCTFCTMLASRGFVYGSESKASAGRHRNCDCRVVPGLPGTSVEGYDLDAVAEQWAEYEDIDSRTHEDGTPWTSAEKRAAKAEWAKKDPVWRKAGQRSVGAVHASKFDKPSSSVFLKKKQFGRKARKHMAEWGLDVSDAQARSDFEGIIASIIDKADHVNEGPWRDQTNPCTFYRLGEDVVIVNADDEFVTIMKGGASNKRYLSTLQDKGPPLG